MHARILASKIEERLRSPSRSGGTDCICPLSTLLNGQVQKIVLGGDAVDGQGVYRTIISRKVHKMPTLAQTPTKAHPLLRKIVAPNLLELRTSDIFTDGSHTPHTSHLSHLSATGTTLHAHLRRNCYEDHRQHGGDRHGNTCYPRTRSRYHYDIWDGNYNGSSSHHDKINSL